MLLTTHERHNRLVKIVRKDYQSYHPKSRLFPNTSGLAWQGEISKTAFGIILKNPRPVKFGIPEPKRDDEEGSGGSDLLGQTYINDLPILTGIEVKTGGSTLKKNQKLFRNWLMSINGIWFLARECPTCWLLWEPIKKAGKIVGWEIPPCDTCGGKGYILYEGPKVEN